MNDTTPEAPAPSKLWLERTGTRTFVGRSARGGEVRIGEKTAPGVFSPGELLQIALAACAGQAGDHRFAHALGAEHENVIRVRADRDDEADLFRSFSVDVGADLTGVDQQLRTRTVERARQAVDRHCTVGRTLSAGARYTLRFAGEDGAVSR